MDHPCTVNYREPNITVYGNVGRAIDMVPHPAQRSIGNRASALI
jgi:hypothetical protein